MRSALDLVRTGMKAHCHGNIAENRVDESITEIRASVYKDFSTAEKNCRITGQIMGKCGE